LKIFKTFDLNPISLNQKFVKQFLFFAGSPNLISARFLWQPNLTPLPFPEICPPAICPSGPIRFSPGRSAQLGPLPLLLPSVEAAAAADLQSLPRRTEPAATSELSCHCCFLSRPRPLRFPFSWCRIDAQKLSRH
jgi:hypothetical protein